MFICPNCGLEFSEPRYYTDYLVPVGEPWRYYGCPKCGSGYDEKAENERVTEDEEDEEEE